MKVLFMISHPAHFHIFRYTMENLQKDGIDVVTVIRPKDILEQLCINAKVPYIKVQERPKKGGRLRLGISLIKRCVEVCSIVKKERPNIMIGSDGVIAVAGKIYKIPSFELFDDDYHIIKLYADIFFPLYTGLIAPQVTDAGKKFQNKKIAFAGYKKLAYLWPTRFTPKREVVEKYGIDTQNPYFILRFAKLTAHHDVNISGFTYEVAKQIVDKLEKYGKVYITSERELEPQLESYRLKIDPLDIHHVMAFASIYLGDSQTMACEAGLLGIPFVRFNDFVGRINYMAEIEDVYLLGYGIHATPLPIDSSIKKLDGSVQPSGIEAMYKAIDELLAIPYNERCQLYNSRRDKMLREKIDLTSFLTWFIENYPSSAQEAKNANEEFWKKFK